MSKYLKMTNGRRQKFLSELRVHGIFVEAARAASPGVKNRRGAVQSFRDLVKRDPEFAAQVQAIVGQVPITWKRTLERLRALEKVVELAGKLSDRYLANPGGPYEFVACITPPRGNAIHKEWRELWELTR